MGKRAVQIFWFRKSLRLHDNPALGNLLRLTKQECVVPVFLIDPHFATEELVGSNRWRFLLESLRDLHCSLKKKNSSLLILKGSPEEVFPQLLSRWNVTSFAFEFDSEPYALSRDKKIQSLCQQHKTECLVTSGHTLYDLDLLVQKSNLKEGQYLTSYAAMLKLTDKLGTPDEPVHSPEEFPAFPDDNEFQGLERLHITADLVKELDIVEKESEPELPSLYPDSPYCTDTNAIQSFKESHSYFIGGESEALRRLEKYIAQENRVLTFKKPETSPNSLVPSTTTLSPYLKFGCISPRTVWHEIYRILQKHKKKNHTEPPVSLIGQLYWREFFYFASYTVPSFDKMQGNPICRQIDYSYAENEGDKQMYEAWANAKTGFPWIDALMTQLHQHGWMHHLGRHAVACFLTRGDLYIHWELGRDVFDKLLLDSDWALNNANWMWLSASAFFHQYHRVYSPISFGKKTDKNGDFIRHFIPVLKEFPAKYIYEPWNAPEEVQQKAGCIIGKDYPAPIVDHNEARRANLDRMKAAFATSSTVRKRKLEANDEPSRKRAKK